MIPSASNLHQEKHFVGLFCWGFGLFCFDFFVPLATVSTSKTKVYLDLMYEKFSALILP